MLDIFKVPFTLFRRRQVDIDSVVFKLHYRVTVSLLLLFCVIATVTQFLTKPVICNALYSDLENILKTTCRPVSESSSETSDKHREGQSYNYYSWIWLCLFFQAVLFYIPHWLWKKWEEGKVRTLKSKISGTTLNEEVHLRGMDTVREYFFSSLCTHNQWAYKYLLCEFLNFINVLVLFYIPHWMWKTWEEGKVRALKNTISGRAFIEQDSSEEIETLAQYLTATLKKHNLWAYKYLVCELLNLINVFGQMFLMNRFLGGVFWTYGTDVVNFMETDARERTDPIAKVFPSIAKCEYKRLSPSGAVQIHDVFCVLPLNSIYEKIYIFLWFWFLALLVITAMFVLLLASTLVLVKLRIVILRVKYWKVLSHRRHVENVVFRGLFGDWLLIYLLGKNMDSTSFNYVVSKLGQKTADGSENKEHSEML